MLEKIKKILMAYDGSECADAALDDLQRAGLPSEAEAVVVSVEHTVPRLKSPLQSRYAAWLTGGGEDEKLEQRAVQYM